MNSTYDLVISLDASSADRMGDVYKPRQHGHLPLAVIDHHATNTNFAAVDWVAQMRQPPRRWSPIWPTCSMCR